jgi:uncharacterized protein involved in cysteine biosynthesis
VNVTDILRRVQNQIGDRSGALVDSASILDYVNDAQLAINAEAEILRATVSGAIVAGTANLVPAIADFLSAVALRIDTATDAKSLDYISEAELDARYP